jgi:hypothetical protein
MNKTNEALRENQDLGARRQQRLESGAIRLLPDRLTGPAHQGKDSKRNVQTEAGSPAEKHPR